MELIAKSEGRYTGGVDNVVFKSLPSALAMRSEENALNFLKSTIGTLKSLLSMKSGKVNQSIARKGLDNLTPREYLKLALKNSANQKYIKDISTTIEAMESDPQGYVRTLHRKAKGHNLHLKSILLSSLKRNKLNNYDTDAILRVFIPKANGKMIPLGIPTMKDRTLQMLLCLIMEPYLEPLGDKHSFGFRPGRNSHQATAYLHNALLYRQNKAHDLGNRRILGGQLPKKYKDYLMIKYKLDSIDKTQLAELNQREGELVTVKLRDYSGNSIRYQISKAFIERAGVKQYFKTLTVMDADIKGCLDNISHE